MNDVRSNLRCALVAGLFLLLVIGSLGFVSNTARASYVPVWTDETPMGDVRAQATVVQDSSGLVYVMGGFSIVSGQLANASSYDPATGVWQELTPMLASTRAAAGAVGADGLVYVFGGGGSSTVTNQIYDPAADSWVLGANLLEPVWNAKAAVGANGLIYVAGGYNSGTMTVLNTLQIYDPAADSWTYGAPLPAARSGGAFVSYDGGYSLYYFGGSSVSWTDATATVFRYNVAMNSWTTVAPMPVARAAQAAVVGLDGLIYVFGGGASSGNYGSSYASGNIYSPDDDTWGTLPDMLIGVRNLGGATGPDGKILALGGCDVATVYDQVESLQVVKATATISGTTVATGGFVSVTFNVNLAYSTSSVLAVGAVLLSSDDVIYATYIAFGADGVELKMQVDIPDIAPPGDYRLVLSMPETVFALTVVDAPTTEEQIADLQAQVAALQAALGTSDANITALRGQANALQAQVTTLQTALVAMGAGQTAAMNALNATLANLQIQLDALQEKTDKVETKADNGGMYGMVTLVLVIVVIVLLALMFIMSRKKP